MNGPLKEESELVTNIVSETSFDMTEIDDEVAHWAHGHSPKPQVPRPSTIPS